MLPPLVIRKNNGIACSAGYEEIVMYTDFFISGISCCSICDGLGFDSHFLFVQLFCYCYLVVMANFRGEINIV